MKLKEYDERNGKRVCLPNDEVSGLLNDKSTRTIER
jgi:hypothetical protein